MPSKGPPSAASALALDTAAVPTQPRFSPDAISQGGSRDSLAQLTAAMAELKAMAVQPLLNRAAEAINAERFQEAAGFVEQALKQDPKSGFGWYLQGIVRERAGDFAGSIGAYETALGLIPDQVQIANDLGRLAFRMGMKEQAEKLFRHYLVAKPDDQEALNNLACAIRDQRRFEDAIETLRPAILRNPTYSLLWNTMGTVTAEQGDYPNARIFFEEALRLDGGFYRARYNLGNALLALGETPAALEACDAALAKVHLEDERQMMLLARSTILITLGRLGEGWDDYEARLNPQFADCTNFLFERPRWQPGDDLAGKSLMVVGEQGLGDEVLFSNVLPDVVERLGPEGKLTIVVEPRLVPLFQRTYPQARVVAHATYLVATKTIRYAPALLKEIDQIDLWTPVACLLREFRRTVEAFPPRVGFLTPDPARVAHWKKVLDEQAPKGPKVGLLWKSAVDRDARHRFFSPFDLWEPVLKVPGACFVNLQYGDCSAELALAKEQLGVEIWTPPGIDLKKDLDDIAALCCAMDLIVGFSNATLNIGAACGAPTWLITTPGAWPRLGTDWYPWYPQVKAFAAQAFRDWEPVMARVAEAFQAFVGEH